MYHQDPAISDLLREFQRIPIQMEVIALGQNGIHNPVLNVEIMNKKYLYFSLMC